MKRTFLVGLIALVVMAFLASGLIADAGAPAQAPTPKPTRDRTRTLKKTAVPAPTSAAGDTLPDNEDSDAEAAIEINPTAPGAMTSQILVFNPEGSAATVQIDIYNSAGAVAYTTTVTVAKKGAKLVTLPGSLGSNFQGGAQVSSDKNVQAIVLGANANKSARDAYEGSTTPALDVTLPFVRHLAASTQNAVLAIQNTTANPANVGLTLYETNGTTAKQENAVIAAHQVVYFNTNTLFASPPFIGSARVVSDQNVAVAMQSLYYKDTAAFLGMVAGEMDTTVYLNQAQRKVNGASVVTNWSEIFARNNGTDPTDITIDFYASTGGLVTSQTATEVPPDGMAPFLLSEIATLGNNYNGWVKISSTGQPLAVSALQVLSKGKRMYGNNGLANTQTSQSYICGDVERNTTQTSHLSILNTDALTTAKVQVRLFNQDTGAKVVTYKLNIPPNTLTNVLLSDAAFAAAGTAYQGMALVEAKGAAGPKLVVTANNPYGNPKLTGTIGYTCTRM